MKWEEMSTKRILENSKIYLSFLKRDEKRIFLLPVSRCVSVKRHCLKLLKPFCDHEGTSPRVRADMLKTAQQRGGQKLGLWWYHGAIKLSNPRNELKTPCYVTMTVLLVELVESRSAVCCQKHFNQYTIYAGKCLHERGDHKSHENVCNNQQSAQGRKQQWQTAIVVSEKKKKEQRRQKKSVIKGRDRIRAPDVLQVPRKRGLTKNTWQVEQNHVQKPSSISTNGVVQKPVGEGRGDHCLLVDWLPARWTACLKALLTLTSSSMVASMTPLSRTWEALTLGWERSIPLQIWKPHAQGFRDGGVYRMLPIVRPWVLTPGPDPICCKQNLKHRVMTTCLSVATWGKSLCCILVTSAGNSPSWYCSPSFLPPCPSIYSMLPAFNHGVPSPWCPSSSAHLYLLSLSSWPSRLATPSWSPP